MHRERERFDLIYLFLDSEDTAQRPTDISAVARVLLLTRTFIMDVTRNMTACKGVKPTDY